MCYSHLAPRVRACGSAQPGFRGRRLPINCCLRGRRERFPWQGTWALFINRGWRVATGGLLVVPASCPPSPFAASFKRVIPSWLCVAGLCAPIRGGCASRPGLPSSLARGSAPSPGACGRRRGGSGRAGSCPAGPRSPAPAPSIVVSSCSGRVCPASLSGRTRTAGGYLPPRSAKPAWFGDPVEARGPAQPHRGDRVPQTRKDPDPDFHPEARLPGSALQAGRGQEGGGAAVPALPGRSGGGAPWARGGGGRPGQGRAAQHAPGGRTPAAGRPRLLRCSGVGVQRRRAPRIA